MGASVFSSAAAALIIILDVENLRGLELVNEKNEDGFHGTRGRLLDFGVVVVGVKRPA